MPNLPHLPLRRIEYEAPRKKRPGFGRMPPRDFLRHGEILRGQIESVLQAFTHKPPPQGINPSLILRVKLAGNVDEETWRREGLAIVGQSEDKTLVLFGSDAELRQFRQHLETYQRGLLNNRVIE
jgi:hypothetical protein